MNGTVNALNEARVEIIVRGAGGRSDRMIQAIVDTGFDGYISLRPDLIAELDLPFADEQESIAFGGGRVMLPVHDAVVVFAGKESGVSAISADNPPLIGMALLQGFDLFIEVIDGGEVTIKPRTSIS